MKLCRIAAAVSLWLSAAISVSAQSGADDGDGRCQGSKSSREVAQDEIRTMSELCAIDDGAFREDKGITAPNGDLPNAFPRFTGSALTRKGRTTATL